MFASLLLEDMIKDTNEQPNEKMHRVRSGRDLRTGASISMKLGYITSLHMDRFTNVEVLQIPYYCDLIEDSSPSCDQY